MANTNIAAARTTEYTVSDEAAAALRLPIRSDISRRELHKRLGRFNRSHGTNFKLPI